MYFGRFLSLPHPQPSQNGHCHETSLQVVMILGHFLKFEIVDVAMAVSRQKTVESWKELKK